MDIDQIIEEWLATGRRSNGTQLGYRTDVNDFLAFIGKESLFVFTGKDERPAT